MEHTQIVTAAELENYANTMESEAAVPELIWMLVKESSTDLTTCRIPYGDAVNQPGWDGLVETQSGFRQFVPLGKSFWEIGTGGDPQGKATADFKKRTDNTKPEDRKDATYVFVTPRGAGAGGWNEPAQAKWLDDRKNSGWGRIKILDGIQIGDWLRDYRLRLEDGGGSRLDGPEVVDWYQQEVGRTELWSCPSAPAPREHVGPANNWLHFGSVRSGWSYSHFEQDGGESTADRRELSIRELRRQWFSD